MTYIYTYIYIISYDILFIVIIIIMKFGLIISTVTPVIILTINITRINIFRLLFLSIINIITDLSTCSLLYCYAYVLFLLLFLLITIITSVTVNLISYYYYYYTQCRDCYYYYCYHHSLTLASDHPSTFLGNSKIWELCGAGRLCSGVQNMCLSV